MKVRILKVAPKVFLLQSLSEDYYYKGKWLGLEVRYKLFGLPFTGVYDVTSWASGELQYKRCTYVSKEAAMKVIKALRAYYKKRRKKETLLNSIERGLGEVVYEEEI